jgi:hypothetical protein
MADHVISVDAGNGGTNAVMSKKNGYTSVYFPSVRAAATGDTLGLGSSLEMQYDYVDWNGDAAVSHRHCRRQIGGYQRHG